MTKANPQKLCNRHQRSFEHGHYIKVKSLECDLCKLENTFNKVLDMPEFRDLRP